MEFENVNVEILINKLQNVGGFLNIKWRWTWESIVDSIVSTTGLEITPRIDGTFAVGHFDAWLEWEYIAPYTPLRVTYRNDTKYYVCKSSCKPNRINGKYFHSFEIFEATALLSNFIVGSKAFSVTGTNKTDYDKIIILKELMQQKYGITIDTTLITDVVFNKEREFTFGAGTTLYTALAQIMEEYDLVPLVSEITVDLEHNNSSTELLPISFKLSYVDKNTTSNIEYNDNEITDIVYDNNIDNYCKYLETEAQNVVDRTSVTTWKNLTVRSEDAVINSDSAVLVLPNNVEEIKSIIGKIKVDVNVQIQNNDSLSILHDEDFLNSSVSSFDRIFYILADKSGAHEPDYDWVEEKEQTKLYQILKLIFEAANYTINSYSDLLSIVDSYLIDTGWYFHADSSYYYFNLSNVVLPIPLIKFLKEKKEWDTLLLSQKPKYMYYESGTNVIRGLYNFYKDDFWGTLSGLKVDPFYKEINYNTTTATGIYNYGTITVVDQVGNVSLEALFDITATTVNNPIIINEKTIEPLFKANYTEYSWKPFARSYDNKAPLIEFDKLEERMQLTNDMLGDIELELEFANPSNLPIMLNSSVYKMNYNNVSYYVMAYNINIKLDKVVIRYSLSRKYSKKASVISVDTQFEATPNPLNNIITRPIYIEAITGANVNLSEYNFLEFTFNVTDLNGTDKTIKLYKRFSVLESLNTKLLYCEMINQYAFDYQMVKIGDISNDYINNPVSYVSDANETNSVSISLVKLNLDLEKSRYLPLVANESGTVDSTKIQLVQNAIVLYKDAREHLTFTIKLN